MSEGLLRLLEANGLREEVLDDYCCMRTLSYFPKLHSAARLLRSSGLTSLDGASIPLEEATVDSSASLPSHWVAFQVCLIQQDGSRQLACGKADTESKDMRKIEGLERCSELQRLLLNENAIEKIEGLQHCRKLQKLYLPFNCIKEIGDGLAGLENLEVLWLAGNQLSSLQGLCTPNLTELNAASNRLSSVVGALEHLPLKSLNLAGNQLCSFKEILDIARRTELCSLSFADPDFGENPICSLCNYQTYTLYHLPKLQVHDQMHVTAEAHSLAQAAFAKKRLYYNMRIKTLKRQATDCLRAAKVIDEARRRALGEDLEMAARAVRRADACRRSREAVDIDDRDAERRVRLCEVELADADLAMERLAKLLDAELAQQIRSLLLELQSGGNVRFEPGGEDLWVSQIQQLVLSRFRPAEFQGFGFDRIKLGQVIRLHHRSLRLHFDQLVQRLGGDELEHLFYVPKPGNALEELRQVAELGPADFFAEQLAAQKDAEPEVAEALEPESEESRCRKSPARRRAQVAPVSQRVETAARCCSQIRCAWQRPGACTSRVRARWARPWLARCSVHSACAVRSQQAVPALALGACC
ncbi:unnamed protein product [Effrenium voratum]|uniref:Uncharacterized protein n=1 Tax=Effrenium voratum TaxID=2562239 RepID=A0AA36JEI4_9DINO|nr:unnamed protein product [Effrenium voratum]